VIAFINCRRRAKTAYQLSGLEPAISLEV